MIDFDRSWLTWSVSKSSSKKVFFQVDFSSLAKIADMMDMKAKWWKTDLRSGEQYYKRLVMLKGDGMFITYITRGCEEGAKYLDMLEQKVCQPRFHMR